MLPCIVIGDSIAVGVGQYRPDCQTLAKTGITSSRYITDYLPLVANQADIAVISLGVNDGDTVDTIDNLRQVRARLTSRRVTWLLPGLKPDVRSAIRTVAAEHGDQWIDTGPEAGRDHLHPTGAGYRYLASRVEGEPEEVAAYVPAEPAERPTRRHGPLTPVERIRKLREIRHHGLDRVREASDHGHSRDVRHAAADHGHTRRHDGVRTASLVPATLVASHPVPSHPTTDHHQKRSASHSTSAGESHRRRHGRTA